MLPIDLAMSSEKDQQRAFACRGFELAPLAQRMDEWRVEGTEQRCDFYEGMSQVSVYVKA